MALVSNNFDWHVMNISVSLNTAHVFSRISICVTRTSKNQSSTYFSSDYLSGIVIKTKLSVIELGRVVLIKKRESGKSLH